MYHLGLYSRSSACIGHIASTLSVLLLLLLQPSTAIVNQLPSQLASRTTGI